MTADVSVARDIDAPAEVVWDMISDMTRMGEWSPENEGGTWLGSATGPAPGAKFRGLNRHGNKTWKSVADRAEHNRSTMEATLDKLAASAAS